MRAVCNIDKIRKCKYRNVFSVDALTAKMKIQANTKRSAKLTGSPILSSTIRGINIILVKSQPYTSNSGSIARVLQDV